MPQKHKDIKPEALEGDQLKESIELTIQQLILKLSLRSYKLLDPKDITGLSNLIRSTYKPDNYSPIWNMIEENQLDCREIRSLIAQEYGISEDY